MAHQEAVNEQNDDESDGAAEDGEGVEAATEAGTADGVVGEEGEGFAAGGAGLGEVGGDEAAGRRCGHR